MIPKSYLAKSLILPGILLTILDHALPKGWLATLNLVLARLVAFVCRLHPLGPIGLAEWILDLRDVRRGFRALAGS